MEELNRRDAAVLALLGIGTTALTGATPWHIWVALGFYLVAAAVWLKPHYGKIGAAMARCVGSQSAGGTGSEVNPSSTGEEVPDWPIADLFSHIDPDVLNRDPNASRWEIAGQQIRDALGLGRLKSWGRPLETGLEQHGARTPVPPPKRIRPYYWENADFTYTFFDETRPFGVADTIVNGPSRLPNYFDLRVNRAKAMELWPRKMAKAEPADTRTVWPDFDKWDDKTEFRLFEAACLWNEEEPKLPMSDGALDKFEMLREAIYARDLSASGLTLDEAFDAAWGKVVKRAPKIDDPINVNTKVEKKTLVDFASRNGSGPRFLFPGARSIN